MTWVYDHMFLETDMVKSNNKYLKKEIFERIFLLQSNYLYITIIEFAHLKHSTANFYQIAFKDLKRTELCRDISNKLIDGKNTHHFSKF